MPPKSELVALQRGVWELTGTSLLCQTPAELQHACEVGGMTCSTGPVPSRGLVQLATNQAGWPESGP